MRLIWISLLTLGINGMLNAQESGKITYVETAKFELPPIEGMDSAMIASLPSSSSREKELYYTSEHSLYQDAPKKETAEDLMGDRPGVRIQMNADNSKCYVNYSDKKVIKQEDFMSRMFLIESALEAPQWKLTGKQETILGMPCQEALIQDSLQTTRVWFAPQLQPAIGPDQFVGFPGAVLKVDMNQGQIVLVATAIEKGPVDKALIKRPKEGKKVTQEEFAAIQQEKMREMQEQYGGEGNVIIRVERR